MNYHVARNGEQLGTLSDFEITNRLAAGELSGEDLAWTEGMAQWQPISSISYLVSNSAPAIPGEVNPYAAPLAEISMARRDDTAELASLGQRLGAHLLNVLTIVPAFVLMGIGAAFADPNTNELGTMSALIMSSSGLYFVALVVYNAVLVSTHGQSLGKRWMKIRIANFEYNGNPGFVKAVLLRFLTNFCISLVVPFYGLVDTCFVFREDRRCIHDLIAGTHVVKV